MFGSPNTFKFWSDFGQLYDLIANISKLQQAIISWETELQTATTHSHTCLVNLAT